MIVGHDLMVQLGLTDDLKRQFLKWYGATVPMKEPSSQLRKPNLSKHNMRKVVLHTAEPDFTKEATNMLVKILDSSYAKK